MHTLTIDTKTQQSAIYCGEDALKEYAPALAKDKLFLITDSNVERIYSESVINTYFGGVPVHAIKAGEASKNYKVLLDILKHMLSAGVTRSYTVVALGGGVVGDIAGLAAALYMRGVNLVQIPTTLLSQVDSSVGGKTAIDLCGVKNVVGAFYQPSEVIVDPLFIKTLPKREIRCGLGEIIKYGALNDKIFDVLTLNYRRLGNENFLGRIVFPCIRHKADVVAEDEKDVTGVRKTLNLGHTTGHAFELYYGNKSHGEFVLIGMYYELYIARRLGICDGGYADRLEALIKKVIKIPQYNDAEIAARNAKFDKKNEEQSTVSLVIPCRKGESREVTLPIEEYVGYIAECSAR